MSETNREYQTPTPIEAPEKSNSSMMLWLLLLLAIAFGLWWMSRDTTSQAPAPALDGTATTLPQPVAPDAETGIAATTPTAKKAATTKKQAPSVPRDRGPELIASSQVMPKYPASAKRSGETGTVMVEVAVNAAGVPTDVSLEDRSGNRDLDRAAMNAVKQWRFEPALRDGKKIASTVLVPVAFQLDTANSIASN